MERTLFLNQVCSATRFVKLSSPLVAAEDEEDGRRIVRMDEQALRVAMGSQSMSPRKTYSSLSMDKSPTAGSASSQSQFDPKVYGRVDYQIVVTGPDADKVSRGKRGEQAPAAELKLWVNVKCSDSESIFISVDGSDFVSWHVNYSDEYAWRKFWKNIPLSAGKHVITLGFKYPQMYIATVWAGTGSFQPFGFEQEDIVDSEAEEADMADDKTNMHSVGATVGSTLASGGVWEEIEEGSSEDEKPQGSQGTVPSVEAGDSVDTRPTSSRRGRRAARKSHTGHRSDLSARSLMSSRSGTADSKGTATLDPEIAKYYIVGDNADGTEGSIEGVFRPSVVETEEDPLIIPGSYEQYAQATAPKPRKKKKKKKKPEKDTLLRNELSTFSFNANSRPTTPMHGPSFPPTSKKANIQKPRTLQDFMARSSFQERKVLRQHDRRRADLLNKKRDIAQFATFQILARSFEIEQAFRFKQRERAVNLRQREVEERRKEAAKSTLGATSSLFEAAMVTEDARPASTDSEMLDEHVHPDAGDDAVGNGPATFSREHERTNDIGIQKDIETKLQDADEPKSALSGPSSDEDEPNSSDEENREGQPHAWSKDQRDIDALDAERLLAIGRSDSPPAGTTVFGKKFYTKDQKRRRQLAALPSVVTSLLVVNAHRRIGLSRVDTIEIPRLKAQVDEAQRHGSQ